MKRKLLPLALFLILAGALAGCWKEGASPKALSPGLYVCTGEDSLQVTEAGPSQVRAALNGIPLGLLKRTDPEVGLEYTNPTGPTVLWAKGGSILLERFGKTRAHGCRKGQDSVRPVEPEKRELRPGAWFRSPTGLNRRGYRLKYPRRLQVDQHRLRHTRFIYAGPKNEPPALTDGFSLHVGLKGISPDSTLREHARIRSQRSRRAGGKRLSSVRDTTVGRHEALFWTEKTAMGPVAHHLAVALGPETIASISYSTVGTRREAYRQTVRRILSTLRFPSRTAPPSRVGVPLAMLSDPGRPSRNGPSQNDRSENRSPERGCDEVGFVRHRLPLSADPLAAALDTLFSIDRDSVGDHRHFLARTNETLSVRHVSRHDSVARVRLEGHLSGLRGTCDHPRARIQIEETARRVAAVDSVALYLNGNPTDLQPDGRGADGPHSRRRLKTDR